MNIAEELQAAIQKNLPAAVASELQSFIEQATRDSTDLAALRSKFDAVDGQRRELANEGDRQRAALNNWAKRETELKEREEKVLDAEHRLEIADLKIGHAVDKVEFAKGLVNSVFRNTTIREDIFKNERVQVAQPIYGPGGMPTGYAPAGERIEGHKDTLERTAE